MHLDGRKQTSMALCTRQQYHSSPSGKRYKRAVVHIPSRVTCNQRYHQEHIHGIMCTLEKKEMEKDRKKHTNREQKEERKEKMNERKK